MSQYEPGGGSGGKFRLDVDPAELAAAETQLADAQEYLTGRARVATFDGDPSGWTGAAAKACLGETENISVSLRSAAQKFEAAAEAVKTFRTAVLTAQDDLAKLNADWAQAESDFQTDVDKTKKAMEAPGPTPTPSPEPAHSAELQRLSAQANLPGKYDALVATLETAARACGAALAVSAPISFNADQWTKVKGGNVDITVLGSVHSQAFGGQGSFVGQPDAPKAAEYVAESLKGWREHGGALDPAALTMLQERQGDPDFASTLLQGLGPDALAALPGEMSGEMSRFYKEHERNRNWQVSPDEEAFRKSSSAVLNSLGVVLAAGTSATGHAALPESWTPQFLQAAGKDSYAPVAVLVWAAQRANPNAHFGTAFLSQSMNAITDSVSADASSNIFYGEMGRHGDRLENPLGRLGMALREYTLDRDIGGRDIAPRLRQDWVEVSDPMHTMFQALGENQEASTQWLHQGLPPTSEQAGQGHFLSPRVAFWLQIHHVYSDDDDFSFGADKGAAFGKVLQQGMTSGGALARDAAQSTAFFFREMGANQLALPEGAQEGVRSVFVHRVDALNWNTEEDPPKSVSGLRIDDDTNTPGRDDTGQPRFYENDVEWLLKQSFKTNVQVAGYAGLSLGHLRQDFNDSAQAILARKLSKPELAKFGAKFGQWKGLLTGQNNEILLNNATEKEEEVRAKKAFASFVVGVLTAAIPATKAVDSLGPTFVTMATGVGGGIDSLTDAVLSEAFPANTYLNPALRQAGAAADASYADGKKILVQWAMENGMVDQEMIKQRWPGRLPDGIAKSLHGYTVDPKSPEARELFDSFVRDKGDTVLNELSMNLQYIENFVLDPAAEYESKIQ